MERRLSDTCRVLTHLLPLLLMVSCGGAKKMVHEPSLVPEPNIVKEAIIDPGIDIVFTGREVADTVYVTVTPIPTDTTLSVQRYYEIISNGRKDLYAVRDSAVHIVLDSVPSIYRISCDGYHISSYHMRNSDHLKLTIDGLSKKRYHVDGGIYSLEIPYHKDFIALNSNLSSLRRRDWTAEQRDSLACEMRLLLDKMLPECHPESATRATAYIQMEFAPYAFDRLPAGSENTLYYTDIRARRNSGVREFEQENRINDLLATSGEAPTVTLKSLDGQTFNISDYRGKWVLLDFWVTWCGPCRRGFEKMKKLYTDYADRLEIVGISCGDQDETWHKALKQLELPWRNLLGPDPIAHDGEVAGFPVPAFPTKVIIDPEGRLRDFTVGEHDEFYEKLKSMLDKRD